MGFIYARGCSHLSQRSSLYVWFQERSLGLIWQRFKHMFNFTVVNSPTENQIGIRPLLF